MSGVPEGDFPLDSYSILLLRRGPTDPEGHGETEAAHLAYTFGLQRSGHLLAAGAVVDDTATPPVVGLGLFRTTPAETRALAVEDPGVRAGLYTATVASYVCPEGSLTFPLAAPPP